MYIEEANTALCLFIMAKITLNITVLHRKGIDKAYHEFIYTTEYYSAIKGGSVVCGNMDGTEWHYVKWNESGTERQTLHFLTSVIS